ncbi:MAG TPA: DUF4258 domain-containing protein, partial [Rhabdochlamydiaceae bacterium]
RNLQAFDGMVDMFNTPETEPLRERITPPEPRRSLLASFKFSQLIARPASQTQERPKPLAKSNRLIFYKRYASNFFINVSSFIDFTIRPRLGELFPGIFGQYDYDLLGLGAQDRKVTKEVKDPKSEMFLQMSLIKKISRGVRSAGREVRRSARKTGKAVKKATKKTGKWIKEHPGETVVIAVIVAATVITAGIAAGAGAAAVAGGGAAGAGSKKKEDEEKKPRPVAPPATSPPPPPPRPVEPIHTAPIGMPSVITQPVFPPGYLNIPPEHRLSAPLIHMTAPVPPVGSPHVSSYGQSGSPIAAASHSTNSGMSPQAGRIDLPRTTSPVAPGLSGGHYIAQGPRSTPEVRTKDAIPAKESMVTPQLEPKQVQGGNQQPTQENPSHAQQHSDPNAHLQGAMQAVGGFVEASVGVGITGLSGGLAAPVGTALFIHGADHFSAGLHTAITGEQKSTLTSELLQKTGMSQETADKWDHSLNTVGSLVGDASVAIKTTQEIAALSNLNSINLPAPKLDGRQIVAIEKVAATEAQATSTAQKLVKIEPFANTRSAAAVAEVEVVNPPTGFSGSRAAGYELQQPAFQGVRNVKTTINERPYSGHAIDQMQNRGLPPTAVENAIKTGTKTPDPILGRMRYHDTVNNITVVVEQESGLVVTVRPGET